MGLFSFTQEIAMDLGTANTIITTNGKIVVDEPSVVALDRRTDKMIAVGDKAKMMHEKTHENIRTIRPLRDGVIADFYACEQMIRGLIKMVNNRNRLFSPSLRMVIGVPSGSTEVELRAVRDSAEHAGGRDVYLIFEPMAAAIGIGIDVEAPEGNMIDDVANDVDLNRSMPEDSKRVPFCNMIYIGDGLSDVPCMKMMKAYGGYSIAVYRKKDSKVEDLLMKDRVDFIYPADYSENTGLDLTVKNIIRKMAVCGLLYDENHEQKKEILGR